MPSVVLKDVGFRYPVFDVSGRSLKVTMMRQFAGAKLILGEGYAKIEALSNVNISLSGGDRLGLIGHNGSGKSTLLRVVAGMARPQVGTIQVQGRVVPLIERAMGINPDLSGYENIELPLRLLGASTEEVKRAREEIPDWTGLGPFIHMPLRTYSDGMKARLSFAICTAIGGDVLVLDEWSSAGDAGFVEQAERRLTEFINRSQILVLASHDLSLIQKVCTQTAWMERGEVVMLGDTSEVVAAYSKAAHERALAAASEVLA